MKPTTKRELKRLATHLPLAAISSCLIALALQVFIIPAKFAPGGISGLSSIIQNLTGFPAGFSMLILNAPLVICAFFVIRKKFAVETFVVIVMTAIFTEVFRMVGLYQFRGEFLLAALAGGALNGIAIGILLKLGMSSGGTDIIGMLVQKKFTSVSISWIILGVNTVIVFLGGMLYVTVQHMDITEVISIVLFSFITLFTSSKCMEIVLNGFSSSVKFEVITTKPDELSAKIISVMQRGVTIINSHGAYTGAENTVLFCVVRRTQVAAFHKILKDIDPGAFAYSIRTREVLGNGFND